MSESEKKKIENDIASKNNKGIEKQSSQKTIKPIINIKNEEKKGNLIIVQAIQLYAKGNDNVAIKKLKSINNLKIPENNYLRQKANKLINDFKIIEIYYKKGLDFLTHDNIDQASLAWNKAIRSYNKIIQGKNNSLLEKIKYEKAEYFFRQANIAFESHDLTQTVKYCNEVFKIGIKHTGIIEIEQKLCEKAREIYEKGYVMEDLDSSEAVKYFAKVPNVCTHNCEYYQKAKSKIAYHRK